MSQAILAKSVTKTFGTGPLAFQALKGVDFHMHEGELVMLAGPSGSGKTTLLSILGCVLGATSGKVTLFGEEITGLPESAMPKLRLSYIGFVFQGHNLISSLTAEENVSFQLQLRGFGLKESRNEALRLLERVGLGDKAERKPEELSGGQRQRVAIARAVAGAPPLILADEPTASLDAKSGLSVTEMLRELAKERGHTVLVVTHDSRIFHLADRLVHMEDGQFVEMSS
ncbi:MAG: ABC transporter ATP-binding protein [Polyangiaceae bacterium]|nr:ABC transporter ATP-binding protein [Polyangiaceae bacterium]